MPSTIPYNPALVLGNILTPEYFTAIKDIDAAQGIMDGVQGKLNDLLTLRRSMDMTMQELIQLNLTNAQLKPLQDEIKSLSDQIAAAAVEYIDACKDGLPKVQEAKKALTTISTGPESPIDYNRTQIKQMPLSSDSMNLNVQYFSMDVSSQSSDSFAQTVGGFVASQTEFMGDHFSAQATASAQRQASSQASRHTLDGTLVIAVTCTHKGAAVLAPFILDPDKGVRVWNQLNSGDQIDTTTPDGMRKDLSKGAGTNPKTVQILSGATYGSSFIGMVHVLKSESTDASQEMDSVAASMQEQFNVSCWFASESGGFGANSSMSDDIKNLLSTQNISSHVSLVTMGVIPSIKSNSVSIGVKQFADFDPAKMMDKLSILANATSGDSKSVASSADAARTGGQMVALEGAAIQNVLSGLSDIDDGQNQMLDINSLMTALDDYVQKCIAGSVGVPINFYVKALTKADLEEAWLAKYLPNPYIMITLDDSKTPAGGGGTGGGTTGGGGT